MSDKPSTGGTLTGRLNRDWRADLAPEVYQELRIIAHAQLRSQRSSATLNTTALVNEAYLKLGSRQRRWKNRKHFYATMAKVMRQVVIDLARRHSAAKRDGGFRLSLDALDRGELRWQEVSELIAIDAALEKLGELDPQLEQVLELRYFAGMSVTDVAELLNRSEPSIKRDFRAARAFLASELSSETANPNAGHDAGAGTRRKT
ncbi:MAG: ECF-type sigma factor [Pseudomonadota bacterium]